MAEPDLATSAIAPLMLAPERRVRHLLLVGASPIAFAIWPSSSLVLSVVSWLAFVVFFSMMLTSALSTTRVDSEAVSVTYGPLTRWFGWQKRWAWSDLESVSNFGPLMVRPCNGRPQNVFRVGTSPSWYRSVKAFSDLARLVAAEAGVPALASQPATRGPFVPSPRRP